MLEYSTLCRKSSTLNCDAVKLGYHKNAEFIHPISDSSTIKYKYATFMILYTGINILHFIPK